MGPFLFGFTFKSSFPYDWIQFKLGRYLNFYIFFFFRRHHLGFVVVYAILLSFSSVIMKCAKRKKHIFIDFCPIMYLCSELFWNIKHLNYLIGLLGVSSSSSSPFCILELDSNYLSSCSSMSSIYSSKRNYIRTKKSRNLEILL